MIAADEVKALRRLLNGPRIQWSAGFLEQPMVELQLKEIEIEALPLPEPVTVEPIEPTPVEAEGQGGRE